MEKGKLNGILVILLGFLQPIYINAQDFDSLRIKNYINP